MSQRLPMIHELKTWPEYFEALITGAKTHELRRADRDFQIGDVLLLREWHPEIAERYTPGDAYSGRIVMATITYITDGGAFGLPKDLCVLSIKRVGVRS